MNDFSQLDAQDGISVLAQLTPVETSEANAYYDELQAKLDAELENVPINSEWPGLTSDERWQAKMDFLLDTVHKEIGTKRAEFWFQSDTLDRITGDNAYHGLRVSGESVVTQ